MDVEKLRKLTLLTLLTFLAVAGVYAVYYASVTISTSGNIVAYGLSATPSSIDWGNVTLGQPITKSAVLNNTGNQPLTLNMTTTKLVNLANFTLTWDAEGVVLAPAQTVTANFTLTIYDASAGSFSLDIVVRGE